MKRKFTTLLLAFTGMMAALVFVSSMISFPIPLSQGETRIHLGNIFCLLSGLLLGPVYGGLAAGIGSVCFDLINPLYIADAPFTFLFKFAMAFLCGLISHWRGARASHVLRNFVAAFTGQVTYLVLYIGKNLIINLYFQHMEVQPALIISATQLGASALNAVIAIIASVPLCLVIRRALKGTRILEDIG